MMDTYFATSNDLFYVILTIVIAVLGALLAWLLVYLIMIIRQAHKTIHSVTATVEKIHAMTETLQEAAARSTSHLSLIVGMVKELVAAYGRRNDRNEKRSRKSKSQEED